MQALWPLPAVDQRASSYNPHDMSEAMLALCTSSAREHGHGE
jgi:hypothetical protein